MKVEAGVVAVVLVVCVVGAANGGATAIQCGALSSCGSCSNFDQCVWCVGEGVCRDGSVHGPTGVGNHTCQDFDHRRCRDQPCEFYANCDTCTQIPVCGWCADTLQCVGANLKGEPALTGEECSTFLTQTCYAAPDALAEQLEEELAAIAQQHEEDN